MTAVQQRWTREPLAGPVGPGATLVGERPAPLGGGLVARHRELAHIDELLARTRRGGGGALALHGEPGVGKSALIEAAVARAAEFRVVQIRGRAAGDGVVPAEWPQPLGELADRLDVAEPGAAGGPPPPADGAGGAVDVAAEALERLADAAGGPVLVTIDDCQGLPPWLVAAVGRAVVTRLATTPVSLVLAWRDVPHLPPVARVPAVVPRHHLAGLSEAQAAQLLSSRFDRLPTPPVLAAMVAGTGGNPSALVDAYGRLSPDELEGWHPLPDPLPVGGVVADAFDVGRHLPATTRQALAVVAAARAAADVVDAVLEDVGAGAADLATATRAGVLVERGRRVEFVHPLVRAATFHGAPPEVRRAARRALSRRLADRQAVESSAYHAASEAERPDESVARALAQAARVAVDRGDLWAAARHEELAARFAAGDGAAARFLARAASAWLAVGQRDRARCCLALATARRPEGPALAEVRYQRARLAPLEDERDVADQMVAAADLCAAEAPDRALAMLVDAAAWFLEADRPADAQVVAERAVRVAASVSSHAEMLAGALRATAAHAQGRPVEEPAERSRISLLIGQTERFPSSPEVAHAIGAGLVQRRRWRQADRWAQWVARCAEHSGDEALGAVPWLLRAAVGVGEGRLADAREAAARGAALADERCSPVLVAWGASLAVRVHALAGTYGQGFAACARLFALADRVGRSASARAMPALALLELQQQRAGAAVAWVRTAEEQVMPRPGDGGEGAALVGEIAPVLATVMLLARRPTAGERWSALAAGTPGTAAPGTGWRRWLRGACGPMPGALDDLAAAAAELEDLPLARECAELCRGVRLAGAGRGDDARRCLEGVVARSAAAGAAGLASLAGKELDRLPLPAAAPVEVHRSRVAATEPAGQGASQAGVPEWELTLLGGFRLQRRGGDVGLPPSLATQAVKIVALRPRLTVDELVELLWEAAPPGVGARRLRNVLWRIRSACGDLLAREGVVVRLAEGAVTDLARFTALADQALAPGVPVPTAARAARRALEIHRGELLPADRYAEWACQPREAVARTHLRLLELLVDEARQAAQPGEALALLEQLAEADPYDERHYLRVAEIHLEAGNHGRAREAVERAERMLAELEVGPSPSARRLRDLLDRR